MEVGEVRVAEDNDFEVLKIYLNRNDGWQLEYKRGQTLVWTRHVPDTGDFKMIRVSRVLTGSDQSRRVLSGLLISRDLAHGMIYPPMYILGTKH